MLTSPVIIAPKLPNFEANPTNKEATKPTIPPRPPSFLPSTLVGVVPLAFLLNDAS